MLYSVCNKLGKTTGTQLSDSDPKFSQAVVTAFRDENQNPIFALTFDGRVFFAVANQAELPASPDEDTDDEIHIAADPSSD